MKQPVIVGCGYVGTRIARHYLEQGIVPIALTRSAEGVARLAQAGIEALRLDLASDPLGDVPWADAQVFHCAPPPGEGETDPCTRRLIAAFSEHGHPRRLVYLGTTGVYGDCGGNWIDETHAERPVAARSLRRWDAEQALRAWSENAGADLVILRVAGIYGPERLPLARIRAGAPMVRVEEAPFTNRIHVEDLVQVCLAAMERGVAGAVYNVSDGHPSTMTEYFLDVAAAAGLPAPPLLSLEQASSRLSEGMLSYLSESRRLRNDRMLNQLSVTLRYPSLSDGLRAIFARDGST